MTLLVLAGGGAAVVAMMSEGRLGSRDPHTTDPSSWWGILPSAASSDTARGVLAGLAALGIITLCLCWGGLVRATIAGRTSPRAALAAWIVWSLPFAVGPPLFSRDIYAYAAQGELARLGLDPATHGVSALLTAEGSGSAFVRAVDPRWWNTHAPYGGAAVAVEKSAAALGGGPAGTVALLKIVAILATIAMVVLTLRLAGPEPGRRALVMVLVAANPVVVVHLIGGAHLDATAAALLVAALVVDRRRLASAPAPGPEGRSTPTARQAALGAAATALVSVAGSVKATALLGVAWLVLAHLRAARSARRPIRAGAVLLAADAAAVALAAGLSMVAGGFGPTWIHALSTSGTLTTGAAPASILAAAVDGVDGMLGPVGRHPSGAETQRATRALCLAGAALVVAWLALRAWRDRDGYTGRRHDLIVLGYGGLAVALGSPVLYPWYLALCLPALAVVVALARSTPPTPHPGTARPRTPGMQPRRMRRLGAAVERIVGGVGGWTIALVVVTSAWLCLTTLAPLAATWRLLGRVETSLAVIGCAGLAAAGTVITLVAIRRRHATPTRRR
ncbi:hypothetical protein ThrDRAFT_01253 [Frankia casuarinae]|uniref:polyprenol phosphomannose-dependent alpha 1,6 mannosyltransferase MptB n=1 Tax=Frankia sp. B2 TaxID=2541730 RepID=UPI0002DD4F0E|nr:hypothetical protein ThrDRAFT_01253 [Frankia casuarinae]